MANDVRSPAHLAADITTEMEVLEAKIQGIDDEIQSLLKAGLAEGKPHWRDEKYLYLIYPTKEDGTRYKEYIGNNPQKINDALLRVERYERWIELRRVRDDLNLKHQRAWSSLNTIYWLLKAEQKRIV